MHGTVLGVATAVLDLVKETSLGVARAAQRALIENVFLRIEVTEARLRIVPKRHVDHFHRALEAHVYDLALLDAPDSEAADEALAWFRRVYVGPQTPRPATGPARSATTNAEVM